jgi:probable phosphoglycerate mutase
VANCSVTEYAFNPRLGSTGRMELCRYNFVAALKQAGAPMTASPDPGGAAR